MKRVISIVILVALGAPFVLIAPPRLFAIFVAVISCLSLQEYLTLVLPDIEDKKTYFKWGMILGMIINASLVLTDGSLEILLGSFTISILLLITIDLWIRRDTAPLFVSASAIVTLGLVYCVVAIGYGTFIRYLPDGRNAIIELSLITLIRDLASNISGQILKVGFPIACAVNPKKTIQGGIGGGIITLLFMIIFHRFFPQYSFTMNTSNLTLLVLILSLGGQIGDLVESLIKRIAVVRDSSNIIPGQGGILDSFDSFIFTAPLFYYFSLFFLFHGVL